jgi:hypothetical protein
MHPPASLSTYLSGGANATCTVLDKTISGMTFTSSPGGFLPASSVTVEPILTTNNPGLSFQSLGSAIGFGPNTLTITYTIHAPSNHPINDASLAISGTTFPTLGGSFQVSELLSNGKSLLASNSELTDSITFAPTTSLTVTNNETLTLGILDSATNQFSEATIPEPSTWILLGVGLSALGLVPRRKSVRRRSARA